MLICYNNLQIIEIEVFLFRILFILSYVKMSKMINFHFDIFFKVISTSII